MQKTWGIFKGFNPRNNPLNKWKEPCCEQCKSELKPWIDWLSNRCIGYCKKCENVYYVRSDWKPSPHVHI